MFLLLAQVADMPASQAVGAPQAQPNRAAPPVEPKTKGVEVDGVVVMAPLRKPEPNWSRTLNFDVRGVYTPSDTPYLRQRPSNGCKPMAGGSASPAGEVGVASALVCVRRF